MDRTESVLSHILSKFNDLMVVTGYFNIDLMKGEESLQKQYVEMLQVLNLHQRVSKPTHTTKISSTLIDQ